ncbi:hypothetical protein D3C80_2010180 [compost metagenome]
MDIGARHAGLSKRGGDRIGAAQRQIPVVTGVAVVVGMAVEVDFIQADMQQLTGQFFHRLLTLCRQRRLIVAKQHFGIQPQFPACVSLREAVFLQHRDLLRG